MKTLIETGRWIWGPGKDSWKLYRADVLPSPQDCTAVFCVAITGDQKIVMAHEDRGWGMLGGHVEAGETFIEALARECLEEGGFELKNPRLFGYLEVTASTPVSQPKGERHYPFPTSYIAYYYSYNDAALRQRTESAVYEIRRLTIDEIEAIETTDCSTIKLGYEAFLAA